MHVEDNSNYLRDGILYDNTYFGLIVEYFHSIEYVQTICLISKYHHQFITNNNNHQIVLRTIAKEFVDIEQHKKLNKSSESIYSIIYFFHNIWRYDLHKKYTKFYDYLSITQFNEDKHYYERIFFLHRWADLRIVTVYSIKYWFTAIAKSTNISMHKISVIKEEMYNHLEFKLDDVSNQIAEQVIINRIPHYIPIQYDDNANSLHEHILNFCVVLCKFEIKPEHECIDIIKQIYIWFVQNKWFNVKYVIEKLHEYAMYEDVNTYPLIAFCWNELCHEYERTQQDKDGMFTRGLMFLFSGSNDGHHLDYQICFDEFRKYNLITRISVIWSRIVENATDKSIALFYEKLKRFQPNTPHVDLPQEWSINPRL